MKKNTLSLLVILSVAMFGPISSVAATNANVTTIVVPKNVENKDVKTLLLRLEEIKAMDKSKLKASDKKNLRIEVRSIKSELRETGGGVYLSVGAIIIIALLLILLF